MVLEVNHTLGAGILAQGTWGEGTAHLQSWARLVGSVEQFGFAGKEVTDRVIPVLFCWDISPGLASCLERAWALAGLSWGRFGNHKRSYVVVYYCCRKYYFVGDGFLHARVRKFSTGVLWHRVVLL